MKTLSVDLTAHGVVSVRIEHATQSASAWLEVTMIGADGKERGFTLFGNEGRAPRVYLAPDVNVQPLEPEEV